METEWLVDRDGHIIVFPALSWDTKVFHGIQIGVRLQVAVLRDGKPIDALSVQMGLVTSQARRLAADLLECADAIERTDIPKN